MASCQHTSTEQERCCKLPNNSAAARCGQATSVLTASAAAARAAASSGRSGSRELQVAMDRCGRDSSWLGSCLVALGLLGGRGSDSARLAAALLGKPRRLVRSLHRHSSSYRHPWLCYEVGSAEGAELQLSEKRACSCCSFMALVWSRALLNTLQSELVGVEGPSKRSGVCGGSDR